MKKEFFLIGIPIIASGFLSCNLYQTTLPPSGNSIPPIVPETSHATQIIQSFPASQPAEKQILPQDLEYLGAFRLPEASVGSNWDYSGQGLTYYPAGDPTGINDGFSGSLFGFGHDQQMLVSEISIPVPVKSKNLEELNTANTLQPFSDISGGKVNFVDLQLPVADLQFLPSVSDPTHGFLHFTVGQHFQVFEPSHGRSNPDLSNPQTSGIWIMDGYSNYVTSDILFDIPQDWADRYVKGQRLATGRFREGVWAGFGPALFAYDPGDESNPPAAGSTISTITPLLLYGIQEPETPEIITDPSQQMKDYLLADHWTGGAWLTTGEKSAVVFVGTKAINRSWYGFANGVEWAYDCAEKNPPTCPEVPDFPNENRGYWGEDYQAQMIFYDPADLAAVAEGKLQSWEPQPYATLILDPDLFNPELDLANSKRDIVMACAFDRQHGLLYVVERLADDYKSVIHVWRINQN